MWRRFAAASNTPAADAGNGVVAEAFWQMPAELVMLFVRVEKGTRHQLRQEYFQFFDHEGNISGYAGTTRKDSGLSRYKCIGLLSHMVAQKNSFMRWLRDMKPVHTIFVRIFDDTNIYVSPETGPPKAADTEEDDTQECGKEERDEEEEEGGLCATGSKRGRTGRRKVQPLLGMLQWAVARRSDSRKSALDAVESVQLFAPSQVMPKVLLIPIPIFQANAATLLHRVGKWMLPGDETPPAHLGGEALGSILREIPFKVVLTCTWTHCGGYS
ncbi:unnamed protein product [Symbiodinium sp. CCMP2592]|nr:unnamed protein product [Symbiodinium sp. CCMP2592]